MSWFQKLQSGIRICGQLAAGMPPMTAEVALGEVSCDSGGIPTENRLNRLKRRYDGYHFSKIMTDVYNPFSLLNAFNSLDIQNYWFSTGTPSYLVRLLSHSGETVEDFTSTPYRQEEFVDYKADKEKPLPMIYQSGYLTVKSYLPEEEAFMLDFPNEEIRKG